MRAAELALIERSALESRHPDASGRAHRWIYCVTLRGLREGFAPFGRLADGAPLLDSSVTTISAARRMARASADQTRELF